LRSAQAKKKKVVKTPSQPVKAGHGGAWCHPSYVGNLNGRITVQASPIGKILTETGLGRSASGKAPAQQTQGLSPEFKSQYLSHTYNRVLDWCCGDVVRCEIK
jgi:hypothetical protein